MAAFGGSLTLGWGQDGPKQDLTNLNIEDLLKIDVVSASKFAQSIMSVPAAIYVLTGEEIQRSGAQTLPEMLRLVPGVHVAQIDANKWMISIRGFNHRYANKLQVLIDGHSIYTPLFSGVNWEEFHVAPDDIDRIEVLRGPGGAVWGANAVNGVVNVITKSASETQGWNSQTSVGDVSANHRLRYGGTAGKAAYYRLYAEVMNFESLQPVLDIPMADGWQALRTGFRLDANHGREATMVEGYAAQNRLGGTSDIPIFVEPYTRLSTDRFTNRNWFINGLWTRDLGDGRLRQVRISEAATHRRDPDVQTDRTTLDAEFRESAALTGGGKISYGLSYRHTRDDSRGVEGTYELIPEKNVDQVYGGFVQMEKPVGRKLTLTLGSTVEHNDYTGWETQPSARLLFAKSPKESYWMGISRAVRTPSRYETSADLAYQVFDAGNGATEVAIIGNRHLKSEVLNSIEIGARLLPSSRSFLDLTAFVNWYDRVQTFEAQPPTIEPDPIPHIEAGNQVDNKGKVRSGGVEASYHAELTKTWRVGLNYSLLSDKFEFDSGSTDQFGSHATGRMGGWPRHMVGFRSSHDLTQSLSLDLAAQYVGPLTSEGVDAYTRLDVKLGYRPHSRLEFSLVGKNLLQSNRREAEKYFNENLSLVPRSWLFSATWWF